MAKSPSINHIVTRRISLYQKHYMGYTENIAALRMCEYRQWAFLLQ